MSQYARCMSLMHSLFLLGSLKLSCVFDTPSTFKCCHFRISSFLLQCFTYMFYAGVRAGGGIGDELESPYGDEFEYARMLYDISFFFFVIVILLAIMQGLIIDAFGELRDQQVSYSQTKAIIAMLLGLGHREA